MSYAIVTFGCRVNQADSQALGARLEAELGGPAPPEAADLVVVNTCAVTSGAEQSARQAIRRAARANPRARIVVTGCYATRDADAVAGLPGVVAVWPNHEKDRLLDRVEERPARAAAPGAFGRTVRLLRIQTGCDERCAFCAIPAMRGRPRSLEPARVAESIHQAAARGFREVVLTGVHLGAYGRDLAPASSLVELVRRLGEGDLRVRLRLSAIEPMDCTGTLVEQVSRSPRVAPHLHLPLQHGSDAVLARMRRAYRAESWLRLVDTVRSLMPDAAIGTDVIAGFPGETGAEFEATLDLLRRSPVSYLHAFPYSDRPGTEASSLPDKTAAVTIRRRVAALRALDDERRRAFAGAQVGQIRDALTLCDPTIALTDNHLKVRIPAGCAPNERVQVRIVTSAPLSGLVASAPRS